MKSTVYNYNPITMTVNCTIEWVEDGSQESGIIGRAFDFVMPPQKVWDSLVEACNRTTPDTPKIVIDSIYEPKHSQCECGAAKASGFTGRGTGHSSWCPLHN